MMSFVTIADTNIQNIHEPMQQVSTNHRINSRLTLFWPALISGMQTVPFKSIVQPKTQLVLASRLGNTDMLKCATLNVLGHRVVLKADMLADCWQPIDIFLMHRSSSLFQVVVSVVRINKYITITTIKEIREVIQ